MISRCSRAAALAAGLLVLGCGDEVDPSPNIRPTAELTIPETAAAETTVEMSAELSSDEDGWIERYHFRYGDDSPEEISASPRTWHTYLTPGVYEVELSVVDDRGAKGTDRRSITVTGPP